MHQSALKFADLFFRTYVDQNIDDKFTIIEIGSQNVNGTLRSVAPKGVKYIGLDFVMADGVDIVIEDPYKLPLDDQVAEIVVTSSCLEHSEFFWLIFLEAMRVMKRNGILYINAPSNGYYHRWPVDCWRFYPDAGQALVRWAKRNGYQASLAESFVGARSSETTADGGMWNDFVAIIVKNDNLSRISGQRIYNQLEEFYNCYNGNDLELINFSEDGPDISLIDSYRRDLIELKNLVADLQDEVYKRGEWGLSLDQKIREMSESLSWKLTLPFREIRSWFIRPGDQLKKYLEKLNQNNISGR